MTDDWDPLDLAELADLLADFDGPWWVAGGHAIDLFLGRTVRAHHDVDVAVLRDHWLDLEATLSGWDFRVGEHEVWARPGPSGPWRVEFVLEERNGADWVFRRNPEVTVPLANLGAVKDGIPYERPEVVLLYKAKYATEPRNGIDFDAALPKLGIGARCWLAAALEVVHPDHPWLERVL